MPLKRGNRGDSMSVESKKRDSHLDPPTLKGNWLEKARLVTAYHRWKVKQYPKRRNEGKWKVEDTARSLKCSVGYASESIKMIEFMEKSKQTINWNKMSRSMLIALMKEYL